MAAHPADLGVRRARRLPRSRSTADRRPADDVEGRSLIGSPTRLQRLLRPVLPRLVDNREPARLRTTADSLTIVAETGAETADGEQQQADREDRAGADPGAAVGGRADRPGRRGGPGFEQGVLAEGHISHEERPGEQAAG